MDLIGNLSKKDLALGLLKLKYIKDKVCDACQKGKQVKSYLKDKNVVLTTKPLELFHMDLNCPSKVKSHVEIFMYL